ncbi:anti-sigma factor antagonist [Roseospira visakhapatnamensis]|uniref:Anti-sigma factor antagonist n=1 Tax=Roseospira visakhapatnamensis TaxID=390880 RepID=A0A7W6RFF8_9PROT|nr:anti-sigma factor antagonist [Roseospira visakhapatnamensis]MBB4267442.1 anti-anti-sigma factor [Roseospira visakhapatnamensis]
MNITVTRRGTITVVTPEGRVDQDSAPMLDAALAEAEADGGHILVDLHAVPYASSMGLRAIVACFKTLHADGRRIALCGLADLVAEVFEIAGINRVLRVFPDRAEAMPYLIGEDASDTARPAPGDPGDAPDGDAPADRTEPALRVVFWGTRGSLPTALNAQGVRGKVRAAVAAAVRAGLTPADDLDAFLDTRLPFGLRGTYGGESSCVQVDTGHAESLLFDLGSGARRFGLDCLARHGARTPRTYNIFLSHLHWDHILAFPFFAPAFIPGNRIRIHGCHETMEMALRRQQEQPSFPVDFSVFKADIAFITLTPDEPVPVAGATVTPFRQLHDGESFGYRVDRDGRSVVYSTDSEHKMADKAEVDGFVRRLAGAHTVVFDAMYSLADTFSLKEDWGHSSNVIGVDLCRMAGVSRLVLFHHEPMHDDATLDRILDQTRRYEEINRGGGRPLQVVTAHDGLVLDI